MGNGILINILIDLKEKQSDLQKELDMFYGSDVAWSNNKQGEIKGLEIAMSTIRKYIY